MLIENVPYLTQRDNSLFKSSSCYPTSVAMVIKYIMDIDHLSSEDVGLSDNMQIEDFLTKLSMSKEIKSWAKQNWGSWVNSRLKGLRTFALVEDHIFNRLMNPFGYKSTFRKDLTFEKFCDIMEKHRLPMPVRGKFPIILGGGHICCAIGFNYTDGIIVMNDPFGNAHFKYKDHDGEGVRYQVDKWFLKNSKMFCNIIERK